MLQRLVRRGTVGILVLVIGVLSFGAALAATTIIDYPPTGNSTQVATFNGATPTCPNWGYRNQVDIYGWVTSDKIIVFGDDMDLAFGGGEDWVWLVAYVYGTDNDQDQDFDLDWDPFPSFDSGFYSGGTFDYDESEPVIIIETHVCAGGFGWCDTGVTLHVLVGPNS